MTERAEINPTEEQHLHVSNWIDKLNKTGVMEKISPDSVKELLESYGAKFPISPEAKASLNKYTNKARAEGMRAVWGEKFEEYKQWTDNFIQQYEENPNNEPLPALKKSGKKNSGMIQFFGQLTSFASRQISFEDFKNHTEARIYNGRCWAEGKKQERVRVNVPTSEKPILLSSIPPEFPKAAWEKISSWEL